VMDASTVMWWLEQSQSARERLLRIEKHSLAGALSEFAYWATKRESEAVDEVWGCGATADNVWLANAYRRLNMGVPWTFRADRCYRTMRAMYPRIPKPAFEGTEHDALDDAKNQAVRLIEILKYIREGESK
ncbi:MAG: 3'-5' exonuclease, partial [Sphaerochaetaceae bacterium]